MVVIYKCAKVTNNPIVTCKASARKKKCIVKRSEKSTNMQLRQKQKKIKLEQISKLNFRKFSAILSRLGNDMRVWKSR